MRLNIGFEMDCEGLVFAYGDDVFPQVAENRRLDDIRQILMDREALGPDIVYSIAMDVGRKADREDLVKRNLLFGVCVYSKGRIGNQPVYSQGHTHAISPQCGGSTPELCEILSGVAIVCMQRPNTQGRSEFYAIVAHEGEKVLIPPGWPHFILNASEDDYMVFGAWCVRHYGFEYDYVRKHGGLSYYPVFNENSKVAFVHNSKYEEYEEYELIIKPPRMYSEFSIDTASDIYSQYLHDKNRFNFVANPREAQHLWEDYAP